MFPSFGSPARARAQLGGKNSSKNKNSNGNDSNQQKTSPAKQRPNNNSNGNNYYDLTLSPTHENSHGNSPTKYGASKPSAIAKRKKKKQTNNNNNAKRRLGNSKPSPNSPKKKKVSRGTTITAIDLSLFEDSPSPTAKKNNASRREIHAAAALRRANNDNNGNNNAALVDSKPPPLLTGGGSSAAQPPQELPNPQPPSMVDRVQSGARSMLQSLLPTAVSQYFTGRPQPASPPLPPTASPSEQRRTNSEEWLAHSERTNQQSAPPNVGIEFQETNLELDGDYLPSDYKVYTNGQQSIALATKLLQDNDVLLFTLDIKFGIFAALSSLYMGLMDLFFVGLFVIFFARGCGSSGFSASRTRAFLMNVPDFATLIEILEGTLGELHRLWLAMNISGKQKKHGDKIRKGCTHRGLLSWLCINKIMWFEDQETGIKFGLLVPHGAFMILSKRGGGFDGKILHSVEGGEFSWLFAFDFAFK